MKTARLVSRLPASGAAPAAVCLARTHELTAAADADLLVLETDFVDPVEDVRIIGTAAGAAVLVLSPSTQRDHVEFARDIGAHAYLVEPYNDDDFARAVHAAERRAGNIAD